MDQVFTNRFGKDEDLRKTEHLIFISERTETFKKDGIYEETFSLT